MNKIGLDYGTSTTLLSLTKGIGERGAVTQLLDIGGDRAGYLRSSIPSLVAINRDGKMKFGYDVEDMIVNKTNGSYIILKSLKRCLNCDQQTKPKVSKCLNPITSKYCVGSQEFNIHEARYKVDDLIKKYIEYVMDIPIVSKELNKSALSSIGISVPAIFNRKARKTVNILMDYFQSEHVKEGVDIINEPTAAMIAGQEELMQENDGIFALCDIGGGTSDIVLIEKRGLDLFIFRPASIAVAGDDVDNALYNYLNLMGYINHLHNPASINYEIRRAKELLTSIGRATVFGCELTRTDFEREAAAVISEIVQTLKKEIMKVYDHYRNTEKEFKLNKIYLSGGGSKMPLIKDMIETDRLIGSFNPDVSFISNKLVEQLYPDDTSIVMVAMGDSMEKSGIKDSIEQMLPFDIQALVKGVPQKMISSYRQLPVDFLVKAEKEGQIKLLAIDPSTGKLEYDLGKDISSTPYTRHSVLLQEFINRSTVIKVKINQNNIMSVELRAIKGKVVRHFNLPWQGHIEPDMFEKYRKEWRRGQGYSL